MICRNNIAKTTLVSFFSFLFFISGAQQYRINWGEELKMKKGTTDMDIIGADNSGVYFTEGHLRMKSYFVIGATYTTSYRLMKFDKAFNELFDKDYKKDLKGLSFHSIKMLGSDLFLFATDYDKKTKTHSILGVELDKNSGEMQGEFEELGSFTEESRKDDFDMQMEAVNGGKNFLMVSDISATGKNALVVALLDKNLAKKSTTTINLSYDKNTYSLEDVKYTRNGKIVLLGKEFAERETGKKKKKKKYDFKQYDLSFYSLNGKKIKDLALDAGSRYVIGGKLIEEPAGGMLLAGFYSNDAKKEDLNGFFIQKIDVEKAELAINSYKEINASMLGKSFDDEADDDDEAKENKKAAKKAKEDEDDEEFPSNYIIRTVDVSPTDGSYTITGEISKYTSYTYTSSTYSGGRWTYRTITVHRFENKDVMVIHADKEAQIKWLNVLPKSQVEEVRSSHSNNFSGFSAYTDFSGYFASGGGMPYYSSYITLLKNDRLHILFNDHQSNNHQAAFGDKVKTISNFKKSSNLYGVSLDLATGTVVRKMITGNSPELIVMPRHSYVSGSDVLIPSFRQRMMAKSEFKMARVAVK